MTQKQSIQEEAFQNHRHSPHTILVLGVMIVTLCWASAGFASTTGPGIALKIGAQTLDDPIDMDKTTKLRAEVELTSAMFWNDHAELGFSVGGLSFGTYDSEYVDTIDGVFVEEFYSDTLFLIDTRLTARFYPFDPESPIRPYVGGGVGYYWFLDSWEDEYYDTVGGITYYSEDEDTDTLADGFFPFVTAGFTVPVGDNFEFLFDFQADFEKDDGGIDLSGPIYMFGCRFRF